MNKILFCICLMFGFVGHQSEVFAYTKKAPYEGYGKRSKVNGLPKTKIIGGHGKKTSKGYTHVNPYARSK